MLFYPAELLDAIESLGTTELRDTIVFRHMLADIPPERINTRGARWNPPDVGAIYTSFSRETSLAEADYHLSLQNPPLRVRRTLYRIRVTLRRVTELPELAMLARFGVRFDDPDFAACQRFGGAVAKLGHDGLIVPSARHPGGSNLVIYPGDGEIETGAFEVIESEIIVDPTLS